MGLESFPPERCVSLVGCRQLSTNIFKGKNNQNDRNKAAYNMHIPLVTASI